jgi:chromosome segregation ATPase
MDISRNYRDEDYLKKGEAQIYQLQQQVDEVRRLLREQIARQHLVEENWKQSEIRFIQLRESFDKAVAELTQTVQVRNLEEQRIKQEIADLQVRASEPSRIIRELRSQIADLDKNRRKDTEQTELDRLNFDKIVMNTRDTQSQITRLDGAIRDLREAIKITVNAQEFYQRELERVLDIIHTNEQSTRRIAEDFNLQVQALREEVQLFTNRIARLEDLQRQDAAKIEEINPVLETLRVEDERVMSNIVRVERQFNERLSISQDRLEEIRQQSEGQFFNVNQVITGHQDSNQTRFQGLDERLRALDSSLLDIQLRIEQVKQVADSEIYELYQLEETRLARNLEALQAEFDMVRQQRGKSQAGGLVGRRAARARARAKAEAEASESLQPDTDSSI